ncbi:mediator of RNA polymerase II transcription subunit 15 [Danio aesculapii]|uniref:mediator of RNA polymerase II transcription subunit 15 n=1 Tax=Danio aesculapii TaxID=1142201 RepID=UPI0024C0C170|nr:mediator of RNA polymerase II transcription subunit 15 [Danio aesculapii]
MGVATMWILSYSLAVLIALGASDDIATVLAYSPGSSGSYTGYSAAVKGGYDIGSYSSPAGSSGISTTSEKPNSDSSTGSQLQGSAVVAGSGSLYGTVGNAVNIGMSGYDASQSTDVQGSEVISSSVLMPLQQGGFFVPKPVLFSSQVQTGPQSSSQHKVSSETLVQLSQTSGQQLPQPSSHSAVHASRLPHKPLRGKPHKSGSNTVFGSRPVQSPILTSKPLKPNKEFVSHPSLPMMLYGSMPSSLAVANYELSQSSGQTVSQPSGVQPPHVVDISVQPSTLLIQQEVDDSVASGQQLVQTSQSVSQSNDQNPVHGSYVLTAQPSSLTPLKPHKGRPQFGSKPPSSTSPLLTPSLSFVAQSTSRIPVQTTYQSVPQPGLQLPVQAIYQSEAQSALQMPGQTSYLSVPQIVQPAQIHYQSASQASVPQPAPHSSQWVAQLGLQQPAHASLFVSQPISQQAGQSTYEYVVEQSRQPHFKPVHSHGVHQIGSKLYSCQELPLHGYQRRFQSPALTLHTKPVVQSSDQTPRKPKHPRPLTSTLQSILTPAQMLSSHQSLSRPVYTPQALLVEPMYQPLAQSSSETVSLAEYQISPVPGQFVPQPQILSSTQSLTQSGSSGVPLQSSFQPLLQSSYETVLQPGFQPSSVLVPSSSQALSGPVSNHGSAFQSVQPELTIPLQVDYQSVTGQNAPGPAPNSKHSSQKLFRLLQQVKS